MDIKLVRGFIIKMRSSINKEKFYYGQFFENKEDAKKALPFYLKRNKTAKIVKFIFEKEVLNEQELKERKEFSERFHKNINLLFQNALVKGKLIENKGVQ